MCLERHQFLIFAQKNPRAEEFVFSQKDKMNQICNTVNPRIHSKLGELACVA